MMRSPFFSSIFFSAGSSSAAAANGTASRATATASDNASKRRENMGTLLTGRKVRWQNIRQVVYRTYTSERAAGPQNPVAVVVNPGRSTGDSPSLIQCEMREVN